jgi:hypothetical protein
MHIDYDSKEENAANLRVSERSMPLCFSSFQILREKYTQVVDSKDEECFDHSVEDVIEDMEVVLDPELQPLSYIDFQILDESLEPETEYELTQTKFVPLSFNSFQFLKKNFSHVMDDKHTENQEVSVGTNATNISIPTRSNSLISWMTCVVKVMVHFQL